MKQYISESRAIYEDMYHGLFSKKLAEWAISNMEIEDSVQLKGTPLEDFKALMKQSKLDLPDEFCYTAWYLYNMARADYSNTLKTDELRFSFIDETINDPDGCPENVLDCFVAKMCNAGMPIYWEKYL